jgi:phosphate transport system substrate-binding protein
VANGDADFGFLSRDLKTEEKTRLTALPYAGTGTGLAVNPLNVIGALSTEQVRKIYSGEITDWSQVGGQTGEIRPLVRENGSSTRASFEAYFFGGKPTYGKNVIEVVESGPTYQAVRDFKGAIAMITIQKSTAEDATLRLLALDGIAASTRNVNSGVYPVRRPIILTLHPDPVRMKPTVSAFFDFIKTAEGQEILAGF